jgi:hypothetical protein
MKRMVVAAALLSVCTGLAACSGGGGGEPLQGGAGTAEPAPAATTRVPGVDAAQEPSSLPKQLCGFLEDEVPRLKARGSRVTKLAAFAIDYAGWIGQDADRALKAVAELDAITTTSCPKLRSQVLDLLDRDTLAEAVRISR